MKRALLLLLAACPGERSAQPDARGGSPDAVVDASQVGGLPDRRVNNVIVGETLTLWSHGEFICSLEFGCPQGPTVTGFHAPLNSVSTWVDGGVGTWQIAGTETELFLVNGESDQEMYLRRIGGVGHAALSIPRPYLMGPAVDDSFVYWAEGTIGFAGHELRRAARDGDGSDATTIASLDHGTEHLTYAAGYLWWTEFPNPQLTRVPVTGGTPERVLGFVTFVTAASDGVYVGRSLFAGGGVWDAEIGHVSTDGSYQPIARQPATDRAPRYIVADGEQIFWSLGDGSLYFAPIAGGSVGSIAVDDKAGFAFAVLPDRFLVELTRNGFRTVAR